jgi:hypothetical protein
MTGPAPKVRPLNEYPKLQTLQDCILVVLDLIKSVQRLNKIEVSEIDGGVP